MAHALDLTVPEAIRKMLEPIRTPCATAIFVVPITLNATVWRGGGITSPSALSTTSSDELKSGGENPSQCILLWLPPTVKEQVMNIVGEYPLSLLFEVLTNYL